MAIVAHPAQSTLHAACYQALWNMTYWTTLAADATAAHLHIATVETHIFSRDPTILPCLLGLLQCATKSSEELRVKIATDDLLT